MLLNGRKSLMLLALGAASLCIAADRSADNNQASTVDAVTQPSQQGRLSFEFPGVIRDVLVKEGDSVTAGTPLMVQDDEMEKRELDKMENEANSTARVDAALADQAVKEKELERKQAAGPGGFSVSEIDEAELDVKFRKAQVDVANVDLRSNQFEAKKQEVKVDRMTLKSPIDGIVEHVDLYKGEYAEPDKTKAAITVVKNDPCWVDILDLTTAEVAMLNVGDTLEVKVPWQKDSIAAKIIFIDPVADPAGGTQHVRLEMPNPSNKTGMHVRVVKPAKLAELSADKTALNR